MRRGVATVVAILGAAALASAPAPAHGLSDTAYITLAGAAFERLPADLQAGLRPHRAFLLRGLAAADRDVTAQAGAGTEPQARLWEVSLAAERLGAAGGQPGPFLAEACGRMTPAICRAAQPFGLYAGAYAPTFLASYEALLNSTLTGGLERRAAVTPGPSSTGVLEEAWRKSTMRQQAVREAAGSASWGDPTTVASARETGHEMANALAGVWTAVLAGVSSRPPVTATVIDVSLERLRFGAREGAWDDVQAALVRLSDAGLVVPLREGTVGRAFFSMHERGAGCDLYRLAERVDPTGRQLRQVADACAEPSAPRAAGPSPPPAPPRSDLSSAEKTGIRAYRHRRGHVLLTNRDREVGEDFVALNFEPIRRFPSDTSGDAPADLEALIAFYAREYSLDPALIKAVIQTESDFDPHVVSRVGARGLMQLMPNTAIEMGVDEIFDPAQNVAGGTQYLAKMLDLFGGDVRLALAAYNAGPGTVRRYGGIPPYPETQRYVPLVLERAAAYRRDKRTVALRGHTPRPDAEFLPEAPALVSGVLLVLRNGLTMRGLEAEEREHGVRLQMETGAIVVPRRNIDHIERAAG